LVRAENTVELRAETLDRTAARIEPMGAKLTAMPLVHRMRG
jgi:hypothetical protein